MKKDKGECLDVFASVNSFCSSSTHLMSRMLPLFLGFVARECTRSQPACC